MVKFGKLQVLFPFFSPYINQISTNSDNITLARMNQEFEILVFFNWILL